MVGAKQTCPPSPDPERSTERPRKPECRHFQALRGQIGIKAGSLKWDPETAAQEKGSYFFFLKVELL